MKIESRFSVISPHLDLVRNFELSSTDGSWVIPDARTLEVFTGGVDGTYDNYEGTGDLAPPTPETTVWLYNVSRERKLPDVLKDTRIPLEELSVTEHQVIQMVKDNVDSLGLKTNAVFFIVEVGQIFYLHQVRNSLPGLPKISTSLYGQQEVQCEERFNMQIVLPC